VVMYGNISMRRRGDRRRWLIPSTGPPWLRVSYHTKSARPSPLSVTLSSKAARKLVAWYCAVEQQPW